ncbi:MAG: TolC family protein [Beijerinckiaceae bacterium]|nr:TolC family protein [Beijerinckiaceae bacterium]
MSLHLIARACRLAITFVAGHAWAQAQPDYVKGDGKPPTRASVTSGVSPEPARLGATVESVLAAGRRLNPSLRAAALETLAAAAKADSAGALDDPMISDNYQFYRNPNVFSGHSITVTQAIPLWGKLSLRREAALADLEAVRGRERAARDALDERIKIAFAQYYAASRALAVNHEVIVLARGLRAAAEARYGAGQGDQPAVIKALGEETAAEIEAARLNGERGAARELLNALLARPPSAPLAEPLRLRPAPAKDIPIASLVERARGSSPALAASGAEVSAAQARRTLAEKAWYPDLTVGAGPLLQTNDRPPGVAAAIGLNIPLPWGKAGSGEQAAAAQLGAAYERYDAALLDIQSAIAEARERLKAARQADALVARKAIPEARAVLKSVTADYAQGRGELAIALEAQHRVHALELKLIQLQLNEQMALAAIERLIGGEL